MDPDVFVLRVEAGAGRPRRPGGSPSAPMKFPSLPPPTTARLGIEVDRCSKIPSMLVQLQSSRAKGAKSGRTRPGSTSSVVPSFRARSPAIVSRIRSKSPRSSLTASACVSQIHGTTFTNAPPETIPPPRRSYGARAPRGPRSRRYAPQSPDRGARRRASRPRAPAGRGHGRRSAGRPAGR